MQIPFLSEINSRFTSQKMRLKICVFPSFCSILIAHCIRKANIIPSVIPANQYTQCVRERGAAKREELGMQSHGCKATCKERGSSLQLPWRPWLLRKSKSKAHLEGLWPLQGSYSASPPAGTVQPRLHPLVLQTLLQKKNYSGFFTPERYFMAVLKQKLLSAEHSLKPQKTLQRPI